jgi:hypothetical protein
VGDDLALVKSNVKFSNDFLDLDATAKSFLRAQDFDTDDYFILDNAFGRQTIRCFGVKAGKRRPAPNLPGPNPDFDVVLKLFSVSDKHICRSGKYPIMREGVCGTPIIYAGKTPKGEPDVLGKGLVGGFMLDTDPTSPEANMLYVYCQTTDELIDDGWSLSVGDDSASMIR